MTKKLLNIFCLVMAVVLAAAFCACESGTPKVTVTFYESDGVTAIKQVEVKSGETIEQPELTKEGYDIQGFYATPALLVPFDFTQAITEDTSVFVAWKSNKVDERPWMLAGSLRGYPENSWGRIWPQDDFLLTKSADAFNTFTIEVNLYNGDEFKIAVIGEGYAWDNTASIDASHLADKSENAVLVGGGNVFDTGANIKVTQTVTFTEADTADWTNGQVAFKCVYGCAGRVANEFWFGAEDGNNIMVDVGTYTIVLDPATGVVTVNEAE